MTGSRRHSRSGDSSVIEYVMLSELQPMEMEITENGIWKMRKKKYNRKIQFVYLFIC